MGAARYGSENCLRLLMASGADIHARDSHGRGAAIQAAWNGHEACLRMLLDARADFATPDNLGLTTPLRGAAFDATRFNPSG